MAVLKYLVGLLLLVADCSAYYIKPTIVGSVYIQYNTEGFASYHFDSERDCYISYSSSAANIWKLDNGERPPTKKPFENVSIDERERRFHGEINWSPTSFYGCVRWVYEMHFSQDYNTIATGSYLCYDANGKITKKVKFGVDLFYRRYYIKPTIVGSVYIQYNTEGFASYHFDSERDCYISYASSAANIWKLDNGERPPAKKPFENVSIDEGLRRFHGEINWSPTSFYGEVRWVYELHFSQDYNTIATGSYLCYDANGKITKKVKFGGDLFYRRSKVLEEQ